MECSLLVSCESSVGYYRSSDAGIEFIVWTDHFVVGRHGMNGPISVNRSDDTRMTGEGRTSARHLVSGYVSGLRLLVLLCRICNVLLSVLILRLGLLRLGLRVSGCFRLST